MITFMHADTKKKFCSSYEEFFNGLQMLNDVLADGEYDYTNIPEVAIPYLLEWEIEHKRVGWVAEESTIFGKIYHFEPVRAELQIILDEDDKPVLVVCWTH